MGHHVVKAGEWIDTKVGKILFIPIIIRVCQLLRIDQNWFGWACFFLASLDGLYYAQLWGTKVIFAIGALLMCMVSYWNPPGRSNRWWRLFLIFFILVFIISSVIQNDVPWVLGYDIIVLFAEYAWTIRTIPPLEAEEKAPALKPKEARS